MKVTVYGGGNVGTQLAVHFAERGNEVRLLKKYGYRITDYALTFNL